MSQQPFINDYYYGDEAEQYIFYRLPKALFTDMHYKNLSDSAKILYGLMLDRMSLSQKNGWLDEENRVFIYFTLENVQEYMNCKQDKGIKLLAELDTVKGIGLIERVKQGQGKPTKIYVKKFIHRKEIQTSENPKSALTDFPKSAPRQNPSLDLGNTDTNNNYLNQNYFNDIEHQSYQSNQKEYKDVVGNSLTAKAMDKIDEIDGYRAFICENISYNILIEQYPMKKDSIDELVNIMVETVTTSKRTLFVGGDEKPAALVKSVLMKLNFTHIEYVMECLENNRTDVRNIKAYLLTTLYNAPNTIDHYYQSRVNYDLCGS